MRGTRWEVYSLHIYVHASKSHILTPINVLFLHSTATGHTGTPTIDDKHAGSQIAAALAQQERTAVYSFQ
jgi:hypothetical protein